MIKLSVWQLAEEITQKDPNKLKYWVDIWKLKFIIIIYNHNLL